MFFEQYPGELEQVTTNSPSPFRIPSGEALGPGRDAKMVEVGKGVIPTIGLHLIRQPAGGRVDVPKTTTNHLYAVISGKARVTVEGGVTETLSRGDLIAVPCWHAHSLEASEDMIVFRVSDEPLLEKLGLVKTAAH